jgi:hypothetical protein
MKKSKKCLLAGLLVGAGIYAGDAAAAIFQLDDGSAEDSIGVSSGTTGVWWANAFDTASLGASTATITSLEIQFSPLGYPTLNSSFTLMLYEDSDNNGNPNDGLTLLQSATGTVTGYGVNIDLSIPATVVSNGFFVGGYYTPSGDYPAGYDNNSVSAGKSWIGGGNGNIANPTTFNDFGALATIDSFSLPGNWTLRANGSAVPEPSTTLLMGLGIIGIGYAKRRMAQSEA